MTLFPRQRLLDATIHEIGDVGILFGFSSAVLTQAGTGHHLTQQIVEGLGWDGARHR